MKMRRVINRDAALAHRFFKVVVADPKLAIPARKAKSGP
jgi:ATP-dependent Clp protease ATP-binding subunit ClpA